MLVPQKSWVPTVATIVQEMVTHLVVQFRVQQEFTLSLNQSLCIPVSTQREFSNRIQYRNVFIVSINYYIVNTGNYEAYFNSKGGLVIRNFIHKKQVIKLPRNLLHTHRCLTFSSIISVGP